MSMFIHGIFCAYALSSGPIEFKISSLRSLLLYMYFFLTVVVSLEHGSFLTLGPKLPKMM